MRLKFLAIIGAIALATVSLVLFRLLYNRDTAPTRSPTSTTPTPIHVTKIDSVIPAVVAPTMPATLPSTRRRTLASDSHIYIVVEESNPLFLGPRQIDAIQEAYDRASLARQKLDLSLAEIDKLSPTSTYVKIPPYEPQASVILDRFYQDIEKIAGSLVATKFKQHYDSQLRSLSYGFGRTARHMVIDRIAEENRIHIVDSISGIAPDGEIIPSTMISDFRADDLHQYAYFKDFVPMPQNR